MNTEFYDHLKHIALSEITPHGLLQKEVVVHARALTPQEAIGDPDGDDFPIQKGKERLMQAEIEGATGQAFTDRFGDYHGSLEQILAIPLADNYRRAVFVAALNAALRKIGVINDTIHCRDREPAECAGELGKYILKRYGRVKITQIGFQPRMVETLSPEVDMRVLDMDPDNIGAEKFGVAIEGPEATAAALEWADLLLVTGSTLVNGTLPNFLGAKPVVFYGTTVAGAAYLMGWDRFCARSK